MGCDTLKPQKWLEELISDVDLDACDAADKSATAGPWWYDGHCFIFHGGSKPNRADGILADTEIGDDGLRVRGVGAKLPLDQNAKFICIAREQMPKLVALVRALIAERDADKLDRLEQT